MSLRAAMFYVDTVKRSGVGTNDSAEPSANHRNP